MQGLHKCGRLAGFNVGFMSIKILNYAKHPLSADSKQCSKKAVKIVINYNLQVVNLL